VTAANDNLLLIGAAVAVGFVLVRLAYKPNTTSPATNKPATSGMLGTSPALNPAAPKTTGDFSRLDRAAPAVVTTGDFARMDRAAPVRAESPAVTPTYNDPFTYDHPL
jgi:hypothetical protein